ncbi:MAG: SH3 domain-containing protein [Sphingomonas sp.]
MRVARIIGLAVAGALLTLGSAGADAQKRQHPYFASISASEAMMRTGPGRNFPAKWRYRRSDLPIKVIESHKDWRKVEDPQGEQGWILGNLLSDTRTAIVTGTVAEMLAGPRFGTKILWRAAPGVVGRISKCARGWCLFDVRGRAGYVEANRLWGTDAGG